MHISKCWVYEAKETWPLTAVCSRSLPHAKPCSSSRLIFSYHSHTPKTHTMSGLWGNLSSLPPSLPFSLPLSLSRLGDIPPGKKQQGQQEEEGEGENGDSEGRRRPQAEVYSLSALPPWQVARTIMVAFLSISLAANIFSHYVFGVTWYRYVRLGFVFLEPNLFVGCGI